MSGSLARRTVKAGSIGGLVVVYVAAVGMVGDFNSRYLIGGHVTLSKLLLGLPAFLTGYLIARPRVRAGEVKVIPRKLAVRAGLGCGAITGAFAVAGVALAKSFSPDTVHAIWIAVTPALLDIMTFGKSLPVAAVILILAGAALGGAGALLIGLPDRYRRYVTVALMTTVFMALLQRIIPTMLTQLATKVGSGSPGSWSDWLYSTRFRGLTEWGAVFVLVATLAISYAWAIRGKGVREKFLDIAKESKGTVRAGGILAALAVLYVIPILTGEVVSLVLGTVGIFLLMGLGLNIVVGYAGLLDLGYVAFFAVGAYMTGVLTATGNSGSSLHPELPFLVAVPIVMLAAALTGVLIGAPVLRLRGDYLAIVTLGFGEIARVLAVSDLLKKQLGGPLGLYHIPQHIFGIGFNDPEKFFYLVTFFVLLALFVSYRLSRSRIGRAWNAMREDEQVAEAMGISTVRYKLLAFSIGASIGCLAGALFAVQIGSLEPLGFNIVVSITALAVIILGGMGSIPGVIIGALVLIGIPNLLDEFEAYRLLIYGAVLIVIMILRPQGLIPNIRRSRELHEDELGQDQWLKAEAEPSPVTIGKGEPA